MKPRALIVALALLATACTGEPIDQTSSTISDQATTSLPAKRTTTTSVPTTTTTTRPPEEAVALIAPSGVPVAVTGYADGAFQILTPCGYPGELTEGSPVFAVDVVIDPGHGGPIDTGAVAPTALAEKEINLLVGLEVADLLNSRGVSTLLTRVGDYPIPIRTRSEYADTFGASALVSIHHNAPTAPASDIPGVEIFVQDESPESARLGGLLYETSMDALGQFEVDWDRSPDAGVMTVLNPEGLDAYGMIRLPETTSALIELGYIANRAEAELYASPDYVPVAALALADAIEKFLTTESPGSGFVEGRIFRPNRGVGQDVCVEPDLELALYPDVIEVEVIASDAGTYDFFATISSPYDSADRYADGWRVIGDDGMVYGVSELLHDHATEQPFTRPMSGVVIPDTVDTVTIQARDQKYGWGGGVVQVDLP